MGDLQNPVSIAHVLVIRPDRIGDVVLSTPVFTAIRRARPKWKISVLVRPVLAELLEGHPDIDAIKTLSTDDKPSFANTKDLHKDIQADKFDAALHLFSDFWVSFAVWRAVIPVRVGPASKIAQMFYNRRLAQHRSRGNRHEAELNLELLGPLGIEPSWFPPSLAADGELSDSANTLLEKGRKNVGVFPSMGGSARNWKPEKFAEVINSLSRGGVNIILMGGPADAQNVRNVQMLTNPTPRAFTSRNLKELAGFINRLDCFVAPSTGPLHMASAVGTPVVGIYCPIRVCLPARWGPRGENDATFVPDVPHCDRCIEEGCEYYDCMDRIDAKEIIEAVKERI